MKKVVCLLLAVVLLPVSCLIADTFVSKENSNALHGYITGKVDAGLSDVNTLEKGLIKVNLNNYKVTRDRAGRSNIIALLEVPDEIATGLETKAFEGAIADAASKGPLFILVEIDSPGGRVDLAMRMCSAIQKTTNCDVYAYIKGGQYGGAYSAAAALSLACKKIYMSPGTVIGAATIITRNKEGKPVELKEVLGEKMGEKISSGWRNYLASLAENNNRSGILAKAMEDKDIEVLEVEQNGKREFIDATNKKPEQTVIKIWSKKGSLLTLTATEAVACGMADKVYGNRQDLLQDANVLTAEIMPDKSMPKARELCGRIENSLKKINASMDLGIKQLKATQSRSQAMKAMRSMMNDTQFVLGLKKKFGDDVPVDEEKVQSFLNSVQAEYESLMKSR
ncbi:MAG: hypothetical protein WC770_07750 [Phycisphaerae bacterium]|jgi:membrane-bound ClpP family serine protease